jgi:undecaprenyl-diphosphatase
MRFGLIVRTLFARLSRLERREIVTVALLGAISAGIWAFLAIASEMREGDTQSFDRSILLAMRSRSDSQEPLGPPWFQEAARDVTALGGVTVLALVTALVCGFLVMERKARTAGFLLLAVVSGQLVAQGLKGVYGRPRPDVAPHGVVVYSSSFPSGHSMMSAATYLTLGALLARSHSQRRVKVYVLSVAAFLTAAVGVSRVYLAVHWPTDVAAGWAAGAAWAALCWTVARFLQMRRQIEPERGGAADR